MGERINKMWYIHITECFFAFLFKKIYIIECYSALRRKEILAYATMWMNLKDIMLNEISESQKDKYCIIPLK